MTRAALFAFAAGALGVLAARELAGESGALVRRIGALVAPMRHGRTPSAGERRQLTLVGMAAALTAGWLLAGPVLGGILAVGTPVAVRQVVLAGERRRRTELAAAAPTVARCIADALGGGHSVRGALAVARHGGLSGAARAELGAVARALELGEPTADVLERLRTAANDPAYDALVAAILLQSEAGGDLAALLRRLAASLEHAARAHADARSLTAQARFTALLVAALPAGGAVLAELARPGYLASIASAPLTAAMAATSVAMQTAAWIAIRRIARASPR